MSFYKQTRSLQKRFRLILASFLQRPDLPFADVLPEQSIEKAFDDEDATFAEDEDARFTPAVTLWAFLSQVLFKDEHRSCVAADDLPPIHVPAAMRVGWFTVGRAGGVESPGHGAQPARPHAAANAAGV